MKLQTFALNTLPSDDDLVIGGIYYLIDGSTYIIGSNKNKIRLSDVVFTDDLPIYGTPEKLFIHTDSTTNETTLKLWNGIAYINVGGDKVDLTEIENAINALETDVNNLKSNVTSLQSTTTSLQGEINSNTSSISTIDSKTTTLETKVNELETEIDNLSTVDLTQLQSNVNSNTTNIATNTSSITELQGKVSTTESDITSINSRIDNLSSLTNVQDEIVNTENDLPTDADEVGTLILVREDSTQDNSPTFYRWNGTVWEFINKINTDIARDFTTQPIDLVTEITGILSKSNYEKQDATETSVVDANDKFTSTNVEGVLVELDDKINATSTSISTLETSLNSVNSELNTINDKMDILSENMGDISALEGQIVSIKEDISTNSDDILTANGKISTLESKVSVLEANSDVDVSELETKVTTIEGNVSTNTNSITELNGKVSTLETKVNELENNEVDLTPIQTQIDTINDEITNLDGKVKLDTNDTSEYISSKLDNTTLQINNNKITVKGIEGVNASTTEINQLTGVSSNIQSQLDDLDNRVSNPVINITKDDIELGNVDNVKQMPISDGTLEDYTEKLVSLTSGIIDLSLGNVFTHTLSTNTTYSITNAKVSTAHSFTLAINQGSTAYTITFPSSVKWQTIPDMSTTNATYLLSFISIDGGSTWLGVLGGKY